MTASKRWPMTLQWVIPLTLFAVLALLAWMISENLSDSEREVEEQRFQTASFELADRILDRLTTFRTILYGGSGLFAASEEVTRLEFRDYIDRLDLPNQVPGLQGVGYALRVTPADLAAHETAIRAEGFPTYALNPPGPRDEMTAIVYLEPFDDRNQRAFGYDMFSEPVRRAAMSRARDTGRTRMSGPVLLLQEYESGVQPGTLLYLPVYRTVPAPNTVEMRRDQLLGYVYSPIRLYDFVEGMLGANPPTIDFRLYDADSEPDIGDLFPFSAPVLDGDDLLELKQSLDVFGRQWVLETRTPLQTSVYAGSQLALKAGLLIAALLALMIATLLRLRSSAASLATDMSAAYRRSEQHLRTILDQTPALIGYIGDRGRDDFSNRLLQKVWPGGLEPLLAPDSASQDPHAKVLRGRIDRALAGKVQRFELPMDTGVVLDVRLVPAPGEGSAAGVYVLATDVTQLRTLSLSLAEQKQRIEVTLGSISDAVISTDNQGRIRYVNPAAEALLDADARQLLGRDFHDAIQLLDPDSHHPVPVDFGDPNHRLRGSTVSGTAQLIRANGVEVPIEGAAAPMHDDTGEVIGTVLILRDISETRSLAERMAYMARHDELTGLPNRILLFDRLEQAIKRTVRSERGIALLFIDLDRFKQVNDSLGHPVGDRMLKHVAARLETVLRPDDTVCRLGGDEFVILLDRLRRPEDAGLVAEKIFRFFKEPVDIDGQTLFIDMSIGIALCPEDSTDADELLKQADTAMYQAKQNGRGRFCFFDRDMSEQADRRLELETALRGAIGRNELELHYQPRVDCRTGQLAGCEALLRWTWQDGTMISPADFIPVAEESGLIREIDHWVIHEACRQQQAWQAQGLPALPVAVNVSLAHFDGLVLSNTVNEALARYDIDPHLLEIEITESQMLHDAPRTRSTLNALRELGIKVAIDDFGTGYSSLAYLQDLPADILKIDQSFIAGLPEDQPRAAIVTAVIAIARSMKLTVVAEGVEQAAHAEFLKKSGCHEMQGFYYARPLSLDAMTDRLRQADQPFEPAA